MAVQAQHPSNALFLNRGVQEQKNATDYSLQPQPGGGGGGGFLDQTHMLFNNTTVGTNTRKRGREITNLMVPINSSISMQSQPPPPQLIDLTQLHNPQPNVVSTGLRLAFGDQQRQHQQQQQQQQHSLASQSSVVLSLLSEDLATQIKQQRDEIDYFLLAQGEQMRRTLADKRQRHYRALVGAAEESVARRLREKEAEAEKAVRRNTELEARAAQLSAEAQAWQLKARAVEATAANLQAQLQHAIMSRGCAGYQNERGDMEEGARLTCGGAEAEDAESGYIDPDRVERVVSVSEARCKACRTRVASVVLLPCRHLCVCRECDGVIQACPLCLTFRSSSVEVFFS